METEPFDSPKQTTLELETAAREIATGSVMVIFDPLAEQTELVPLELIIFTQGVYVPASTAKIPSASPQVMPPPFFCIP